MLRKLQKLGKPDVQWLPVHAELQFEIVFAMPELFVRCEKLPNRKILHFKLKTSAVLKKEKALKC